MIMVDFFQTIIVVLSDNKVFIKSLSLFGIHVY